MAYSKRITREDPSCLIILVDQSGSMSEAWGTGKGSKADGVAEAVNMTLRTLALMCKRGTDFYNYFDVAVIGYGAHKVGSALGGALTGKALVSMSELAPNPLRVAVKTNAEGGQVKIPIWVEPAADGDTPMVEALTQARKHLETWISSHPKSFPPFVLNVTDGESTTGDPAPAAGAIAALRTEEGNVLVMNCHISSQAKQPIMYPTNIEAMPDRFAQQLYAMSSAFPAEIIEAAGQKGIHDVPPVGSRAFAFNVGTEGMMRFFSVVLGSMKAQR
jgi:hypothetical protein